MRAPCPIADCGEHVPMIFKHAFVNPLQQGVLNPRPNKAVPRAKRNGPVIPMEHGETGERVRALPLKHARTHVNARTPTPAGLRPVSPSRVKSKRNPARIPLPQTVPKAGPVENMEAGQAGENANRTPLKLIREHARVRTLTRAGRR